MTCPSWVALCNMAHSVIELHKAGSWCAQEFVCALQESLFPLVLWGFYNQILSSFKVRTGAGEEIPLVQGKEERLRFAGAAVKRYPMSKVRETQARW